MNNNYTDRPGCRAQLWLPLFMLIAVAAYWPARHAGFVTDWIGGQEFYENGTIWQALNSFGWRAILPVMFTLNYSMYHIFGTSWLPWFTLFVGLHSYNAWLFMRMIERLPQLRYHAQIKTIAVGTGLLFLLSPYNAEPVVWKATVHYLLGLTLFLSALHEVLHDVEMPESRFGLRIAGLFTISIFLTEWAVVMPALITFFIIAITLYDRQWRLIGHRLGYLAAPIWILLGGWFLLNKYYLGHWAGHYGDDTHLNLNLHVIGSTAAKYAAKMAFFTRYMRDAWQQKIYGPLDREAVVQGLLLVLAVSMVLWAAFQRKIHAPLRVAGLAVGLYAGAILPVSNLFFSTTLLSENDRYSYFASGFFWMGVIILLSGLPRWIFSMLLACLVLISAILLVKTTRLWGQAEDTYAGLIADFRWFDKKEVVILASPDNLRGVPVARIIGEPSGIKEAIWQRRRQRSEGAIYEAVQFNMVKPSDGIKVERDSSGLSYKIAFMQDGNWFWRDGIGAKSYENEVYSLKKNEWDCTLTFKAQNQDRAVIYPVGARWVEIK
jgi:hypothetical protein